MPVHAFLYNLKADQRWKTSMRQLFGDTTLYWVCLTLYSSVVIVNISAKVSASMHMGNEFEPTMWTHLSSTQVCSEEIHWCTRHAGLLLCHAQYNLECLVQPTRAPDNPAQTTIEVYHAPYSHYICRRGPTDRSIICCAFWPVAWASNNARQQPICFLSWSRYNCNGHFCCVTCSSIQTSKISSSICCNGSGSALLLTWQSIALLLIMYRSGRFAIPALCRTLAMFA